MLQRYELIAITCARTTANCIANIIADKLTHIETYVDMAIDEVIHKMNSKYEFNEDEISFIKRTIKRSVFAALLRINNNKQT